jgi:hypothetical protein
LPDPAAPTSTTTAGSVGPGIAVSTKQESAASVARPASGCP